MWPGVSFRRREFAVVDSLVAVFFLDRESCENTFQIIDAVLRYLRFIGPRRIHYYLNEAGFPCKVVDLDNVLSHYLSRKGDDLREVNLVMLDSNTYEHHFQLQYHHVPVAADPDDKRKSVLFLQFSKSGIEAGGLDAAVAFSRDLATQLPYASGYVSPALVYGSAIGKAWPYAIRHPGFDIADPVAVAKDLEDRLPGVYWLNFLGPRLCEKLGGYAEIHSVLPQGTQTMLTNQGGVTIQLGMSPEVGDIAYAHDMPLYQVVAKQLQDHIHIPEDVYFHDIPLACDRDAQLAWHRRYLWSKEHG